MNVEGAFLCFCVSLGVLQVVFNSSRHAAMSSSILSVCLCGYVFHDLSLSLFMCVAVCLSMFVCVSMSVQGGVES